MTSALLSIGPAGQDRQDRQDRLVRSFVGLPLPGELQTRVMAVADELAPLLPDVRWSRKAENLHVTVKFLGATPEDRLLALGAALDEGLAGLPSFRLQLHRLGAFPAAPCASVLWAWADDVDGGLAAVTAAVETTAAELGFPREARPLTGHVTVGRAKREGVDAQAVLDAFAERVFGELTVDHVNVYESRLGGAPGVSPTHIVRHSVALGVPARN